MATAYIDPGSPLADYLDDDETAVPSSLDEVVLSASTVESGVHVPPAPGSSSTVSPVSAGPVAGPASPGSVTISASLASPTSTISTVASTSSPVSASTSSPVSASASASAVPLISSPTPTSASPIPISAGPITASTASTTTSTTTTTTDSLLSVRPEPSRKLSDDGFAERFKYLICSSALLEKDYVPGLGSDHDAEVSEPSSSPRSGHFVTSPTDGPQSNARRTVWEQAWPVIRPVLKDLQRTAGGRWDIALAGAVALLSVAWMLGWKRVLSIVVMAVCAIGFWVYLSLDKADVQQEEMAARRPDDTATPLASAASAGPGTRIDALNSLTDLLASSRKLDSSIEKSLSHLNPHPTDHQQLHSLRVALHRLTTAMTDNLATATSSLLELVDKDELAVLGEMYDIPVAGSFLYSRKGRQAGITDDDADELGSQDLSGNRAVTLGGSVPSPRRPRLSLSLHPPGIIGDTNGGGTTAQPMSLSRSLPGRDQSRHTHTPRSHHLSLSLSPRWSHTPTSAVSAPDDRFTSLPNRTPRISKRSSWDVDTWSAVRDQLSPSPSVRVRRLSRPSHERRITEADENEAEVGDAEERANVMHGVNGEVEPGLDGRPPSMQYGLSASASVPTSPSPFSRQTRTTRRSPLAGDPNVETLPSNGNMPSPFKSAPFAATTPNAKRRSLQNMPYNPPTSSPPENAQLGAGMAGAGLTRTRSLPFTDIQSLRSRYATGNRSRTSSIVNGSPPGSGGYAPEFAVALHSPTPRIRRVVSVSPLTLPSLKAACHAIHMRRRRLACCLLGLRFTHGDHAYWDDVVSAMRDLQAQVESERERLDEAIVDARAQLFKGIKTGDEPEMPAAPWRHRPMDSLDSVASSVNYAPRSSDEALLLEQIDAIRFTLDKAWKDLDRVSRALGGATPSASDTSTNRSVDKVDVEWSGVRRDLGEMVRSWERGREVLKRIAAAEAAQQARHGITDADVVAGEITASAPNVNSDIDADTTPDFIRAWSDDGGSPSTSFETDREPASLDSQPGDSRIGISLQTDQGALPPPGKDVVFELDIPDAAVRERSNLSRDERIRLSKEARAKGLTLGEMLSSVRAGTRPDGSQTQAEEMELEMDRRVQERERLKQGGMVLDELRGMMDLIKARKV